MDKHLPAYVTVIHHFDQPIEKVFNAFLNHEIASQFLFATPDGVMVKSEIDPKVGGVYTFIDRRQGEDVLHTGEYLEIKKPHRLIFTFKVPQFSSISTTVELDFFDESNGCEVTLKHTGVLPEYQEKTKDGWATILRRLGEVLS